MIVVFHCWVEAGQPLVDNGVIRNFIGGSFLGVDLFFVVSGFVLFLPMVRRGGPGDGWAYVLRRVGRIAPAYYVALFIAVALGPWVRIIVPDKGFLSIAGFAHVVMLQTPILGNSTSLGFGAIGQVWTLSNEMIFYALLFFAAPAFARRPAVGLSLAAAATLLWRLVLSQTVHSPNLMQGFAFQFPTYLMHFALGMIVAVIHVRQPARARKQFARFAPLLFLVAAISAVWLVARAGWRGFADVDSPGDHQLRSLGTALAFAAVLLCVVNGPAWIRRTLDVRPLHWFGGVSYGVYLYHLFFLGFAAWARGGPLVPQSTGTNQMFVALIGWTVPAVSLAAWASYTFLESPVRERFRAAAAAR
jgi:peptidoglycan/LPS O-acetylase OafA/YrhL